MSIDPADVVRVLGGQGPLKRVHTVRDLRIAVEDGLPVGALDHVTRYVTRDERSALALKHSIVPKTTLQRRQRLNPEESQRLERLARMTALAEEVWEDVALAHEFLNSPQPQLGGERPVELARSDLGTREVEALLFRMEHALPV